MFRFKLYQYELVLHSFLQDSIFSWRYRSIRTLDSKRISNIFLFSAYAADSIIFNIIDFGKIQYLWIGSSNVCDNMQKVPISNDYKLM